MTDTWRHHMKADLTLAEVDSLLDDFIAAKAEIERLQQEIRRLIDAAPEPVMWALHWPSGHAHRNYVLTFRKRETAEKYASRLDGLGPRVVPLYASPAIQAAGAK